MNEIKFRGLQDGEWIYGSHHKILGRSCILVEESDELDTMHTVTYLVDEGTIGQYVETKDIRMVEIYDGDIVSVEGIVDGGIFTVVWDKYMWNGDGFWDSGQDIPEQMFSENAIIEVIGNIHQKDKI